MLIIIINCKTKVKPCYLLHYLEKDHASAIGVLYCIKNNRMIIIIIIIIIIIVIIIISTYIKQHTQKCN